MTDPLCSTSSRNRHRLAWSISIGGIAALCAVLVARQWLDPASRQFALTRSLSGPSADWLPFLCWLLPVPLFAMLRSPVRVVSAESSNDPRSASLTRNWLGPIAVGLIAFAFSHFVGRSFVSQEGSTFPPAYHDEYSYRLQTETFAAGRTWFPSLEPRPELFDQMHVLNEGRFASRYFPGVGAWLLPGLVAGNIWLAQRVAHAIAAALLVWCGCELRDQRTGLIAGLLFAVSPGLATFSNLLLAHHPTLVGLTLFVATFLCWLRTGSRWMLLLAGCGLSFAMLCRPMTAAGFALPFGGAFAYWLGTGRLVSGELVPGQLGARQCGRALAERSTAAMAMTLPLLAGFAILGWYNHAITGSVTESPYQRYTDIYTPRHVYGFNNVERGEQRLGPKVLDNYDRWAENLTPALAARNVGQRLVWSLRWTLGIVLLGMAGIYWLIAAGKTLRDSLLALSILSLHIAHVPYWFEGIMGWHYVLESAPCWLLLFAVVTSRLIDHWNATGQWGLRLWWGVGLVIAVTVNTVSLPLSATRDGVWWAWEARLDQATRELIFARGRYAFVETEVDSLRAGQSAVVLVLADPADRSLDYVRNRVPLTGPVLWVRVPENERQPDDLGRIAALFPDRVVLVLDAARLAVRRWP
ncbi:MAG: hypothetical protein R3B90_06480 [Planctomycetaceae bacterium]